MSARDEAGTAAGTAHRIVARPSSSVVSHGKTLSATRRYTGRRTACRRPCWPRTFDRVGVRCRAHGAARRTGSRRSIGKPLGDLGGRKLCLLRLGRGLLRLHDRWRRHVRRPNEPIQLPIAAEYDEHCDQRDRRDGAGRSERLPAKWRAPCLLHGVDRRDQVLDVAAEALMRNAVLLVEDEVADVLGQVGGAR